MTFKIGDWVQLKHGGPAMKIIQLSVGPNEEVKCMWHAEFAGEDGNRRMRMGTFPIDTLQPYTWKTQPPSD